MEIKRKWGIMSEYCKNCEVLQQENEKLKEENKIMRMGCNNCSDIDRCKEQQCKKDCSIKDVIQAIKEKAGAYHCDLSKELKDLFERIPKITRCDVVLEKQLQAEREKVKTFENMLNYPEVKVALIDVKTGEREVWRKLGNKAQRYKQAIEEIKEAAEKETTTRMLFADKKSFSDFNKILDIIRKAKGEEE